LKKDKIIQIRASEADKNKVQKVADKHGFTSIASFFWFAVSYFNRRKPL